MSNATRVNIWIGRMRQPSHCVRDPVLVSTEQPSDVTPHHRRSTVATICLAAVLTACGFIGGDDSGIGGFDRTPITQVRVLGSVDDDGVLTIVEQAPVAGEVAHPGLAPAGPVEHLRDIFDYGLESDRVYHILLTPTAEVQQDPDLGSGQYSVLYLHDPDTDRPAGRFPERGVDTDRLLDCLQETFQTQTRFDALIEAVEAGGDPLWDCN